MSRNPLEIDLILQIIANNLKDEDLRTCRLLNRQWQNAMEKEFLKRFVMLQVTRLPHVKKKINKNHVTMSRLLEIAVNVDDSDPLVNLFRRCQNFEVLDLKSMPLLPYWNNFLTAYGEQLRKLTLYSTDLLENVDNFVAILSCKFTPSLEELGIELDNTKDSSVASMSVLSEKLAITAKVNKNMRQVLLQADSINSIPTFMDQIPWQNILPLYPNMKKLAMYGLPRAVFKNIAATIAKIRKGDSTKWNLTNVSVHGYPVQSSSWKTTDTGIAFGQEIINDLLVAKLQLQVFTMDDSAGFHCMDFANNQHNTIKVLKMQTEMTNQTFQMMPNLKHLTIDETLNMTFLDKAPNLISLQIAKPFNNNSPLFWPANSQVVPLMSLTKLNSDAVVWKSYELNKLFRYMPNINEMEMQLTDETLLCVYEHLLKLRKLTVLGEIITDDGIVGPEDTEGEDGVGSFTISNLKELEVFNMHCDLTHTGLTARSITCGFLRLKNLAEAHLILRAGVDPDLIQALYKNVPNLDLTYYSLDD